MTNKLTPQSPEEWLQLFVKEELPQKIAMAESRIQWRLHWGFDPETFKKYQTSSLLTASIPFENGYTAVVIYGLAPHSLSESKTSYAYLGVSCFAMDAAHSEMMEVFDLSDGAIRAYPQSSDRGREAVCESYGAKPAVLALRQIEGLPSIWISLAQKQLWTAISSDDLNAAQVAWSSMADDDKEKITLWKTDALECALASGANRCCKWLAEIESKRDHPWCRLPYLLTAALKSTLKDRINSESITALAILIWKSEKISDVFINEWGQEMSKSAQEMQYIKSLITKAQALAEAFQLDESLLGSLKEHKPLIL